MHLGVEQTYLQAIENHRISEKCILNGNWYFEKYLFTHKTLLFFLAPSRIRPTSYICCPQIKHLKLSLSAYQYTIRFHGFQTLTTSISLISSSFPHILTLLDRNLSSSPHFCLLSPLCYWNISSKIRDLKSKSSQARRRHCHLAPPEWNSKYLHSSYSE